MKKIAIFGKPGSGKSTLSKALASAVGIPLYQLDSLVFKANGERVAREIYDQTHQDILSREQWIIDGFGPLASFNRRLTAADTLIYIDLPYPTSYWLATKRMLKGLWVKPEGWPDGSSVLKGTLQSYKMLKLSPTFWNDDFVKGLTERSQDKELHHIKSVAELNGFVRCVTK
ncbi:topology modulation protein [Agarivorans sp. Toyoura001]|uniref:shikimate kinase n=1 Tax=Agarivorans sp. Toyoura001 TaxID=2283141 RepID=UPI0010EFA3F0|nr:shikimate kinase [Agarivorans sp. Toyoura001]GDY25804.1 topology modulation protein [Agarivorans sp. Toyoura001]